MNKPHQRKRLCTHLLRSMLIAVIFFVTPGFAQDIFEAQISQYDWPNRSSADSMLFIPQLKRAVNYLLDSQDSTLIVRYPGGDAGNEWALELQNNLISLGIESDRIALQPGSGIEETLLVIVSASQ